VIVDPWQLSSLLLPGGASVPAAGSGSAGEAATAVAAKCRHPPSREAERPSLDITDCCKNSSVESSDLVRRGLSQAGPYTG
jgi:hypothetical protein